MFNLEFLILLLTGTHLVTPFLDNFMLTSVDGVNYYGEVHQSKWNCWIHTIGMPFTFYGISCWFPVLLGLSRKNRNKLQYYIWTLYFTHYISIDFLQGIFCSLFYLLPMVFAYDKTFYEKNKWNLFKHGLIYSFISLFCQEILGHYIGGDDPSRFEAIPNAIMYATYFSTKHIFC